MKRPLSLQTHQKVKTDAQPVKHSENIIMKRWFYKLQGSKKDKIVYLTNVIKEKAGGASKTKMKDRRQKIG